MQAAGGIAGHIITLIPRYSERFLRFRADSSFPVYRTDTLYQSGNYSLKQDDGETIMSYEARDGQRIPRQRAN